MLNNQPPSNPENNACTTPPVGVTSSAPETQSSAAKDESPPSDLSPENETVSPALSRKSRYTTRHPDKDENFFEALAMGAPVIEACRVAEYTRRAVYLWRDQDKAFSAAWKKAKAFALENLEEEADRRGLHGYDETHFRGKQVYQRRKFSDRLLLARLRALCPQRYGEGKLMEAANKPDRMEFVVRHHVGDLKTNEWLDKMFASQRLTEDEIPPHLLKFYKLQNPQETRRQDQLVPEGWYPPREPK